MSQKVEKPVLFGQRIKPIKPIRKRDEKKKTYDPLRFRDYVITRLDKCVNDFEAISQLLVETGSKFHYLYYGESLFDILIAGGIFVPGGPLSQKGKGPYKTKTCIFCTPDEINLEIMKSWEQVFIKLMRRFTYLEKIFQDEIKKILLCVKYFAPSDRQKLSVMVFLWISNKSIPFNSVVVLNNSHLVKDHLALDFLIDIFKWWREDKGVASLHSAIKKYNIESHLKSFIPTTKQSHAYIRAASQENGVDRILKLYDQHQQEELQTLLSDGLQLNKPIRDIVSELKEFATRKAIREHETVCIIWTTVMAQADWNKKEKFVTDQAVPHLKQYTGLFSAFTQNARSELSLLLKVQDYCYCNMTFMRAFQKIIVLFYKMDVICEQVIFQWYREDYNVKGKMMFVDQMKEFLEWLQNAEEESDSDSA